MKTSDIFTTGPSSGYELLDSGEGEKLERFGEFTIRAGFVAKTSNGADFHANTGAKRTA